MPDHPDIAALLGSRICHDLISPIGAISNGVELLLLDGANNGPEMSLVAESVAHANARIRFFRVAFGQTSTDQRIGEKEVSSILANMTHNGRLSIEWTSPNDLSRREIKLAFLLILCLENALSQGGHITVERIHNQWQLTGSGPRLRLEPGLWEMLTGKQTTAEIAASQVQFLMVPQEVERQHRHLTVAIEDGKITLGF